MSEDWGRLSLSAKRSSTERMDGIEGRDESSPTASSVELTHFSKSLFWRGVQIPLAVDSMNTGVSALIYAHYPGPSTRSVLLQHTRQVISHFKSYILPIIGSDWLDSKIE